MEDILIHPAYFGPISQYVAMAKAGKLVFENEDNYQKQTYRNRTYIYDANGKLLLNIPIKHASALGLGKNKHQKYKDVQIEDQFNWQLQHWRALKNSYQTSPFFEFYEDELYPIYHNSFDYLIDFNYACLEFVKEMLPLEFENEKTSEFDLEPKELLDLRKLINAKSNFGFENSHYTQVFEPKLGFLPNLCVLDLLFNMGPASLEYLETQNLDLKGLAEL